MNATGVLFLAKAKPTTTRTTRGEFQLQLLAYDRISHNPPMSEAYRITWVGPSAEMFWDQCAEQLVPGQPIRVCIDRIRSHSTPRSCEIHANVHAMGLAPRSQSTQQVAEQA